jgi:hypothetical protein
MEIKVHENGLSLKNKIKILIGLNILIKNWLDEEPLIFNGIWE